jgi:hypothetical protein
VAVQKGTTRDVMAKKKKKIFYRRYTIIPIKHKYIKIYSYSSFMYVNSSAVCVCFLEKFKLKFKKM